MATFVGLRLVAFTTAFACCGAVHAQTPAAFGATATPVSADTDDMAMPDDLGAPLAPSAAAALTPTAASAPHFLSVDMPIGQIAANPKGKAVLEQALPGLCERVEYPMFKGMSLQKLASMSNGRITTAKLDLVQADLTRIGPVDAASYATHAGIRAVFANNALMHRALYPLTHTAADSIHYGRRQIGQFSKALYHRVVLVVAAM